MKWIALTGKGKTRLANELAHLGYMKIDFTDFLKDLAIDALSTCIDISKSGLEEQQSFLKAFARVIGFDRETCYVDDALDVWEQSGRPPCVVLLENDFQVQELRHRGFLVEDAATIWLA